MGAATTGTAKTQPQRGGQYRMVQKKKGKGKTISGISKRSTQTAQGLRSTPKPTLSALGVAASKPKKKTSTPTPKPRPMMTKPKPRPKSIGKKKMFMKEASGVSGKDARKAPDSKVEFQSKVMKRKKIMAVKKKKIKTGGMTLEEAKRKINDPNYNVIHGGIEKDKNVQIGPNKRRITKEDMMNIGMGVLPFSRIPKFLSQLPRLLKPSQRFQRLVTNTQRTKTQPLPKPRPKSLRSTAVQSQEQPQLKKNLVRQ